MNETNLPETRLRSWRPRRPSAALKRRIFSATGLRQAPGFLGWLAPAAACVLLTVLSLRQDNSLSAGSRPGERMIAMIMSNQSCASYASGDLQSGQNRPRASTFDWTNRSVSPSSISFTPSTGSGD